MIEQSKSLRARILRFYTTNSIYYNIVGRRERQAIRENKINKILRKKFEANKEYPKDFDMLSDYILSVNLP